MSRPEKTVSPGTIEREKLRTVLGMLPEDGSRKRWTDLEKAARNMKPVMSIRTLKKNLDKLEKSGLVTRYVEASAHPPGVYYSQGSIKFSSAGQNFNLKFLTGLFNQLNDKITELKKKNPEEASQKLALYVEFNMTEALRTIVLLFLREAGEKGSIEDFNRWMDVVVNPRLELLLKLCNQHFDIAEQSRESLLQTRNKILCNPQVK